MIRPFTPEDTKSVMEIWLSASLLAHDFIPASYWQEQFEVVRDQYLLISATCVFVKQDCVCGFLSILNGDTIGALFVASDSQRQGIGTALLCHVQEIAYVLTLCMYVENSAAKRFYKKQGFEILSRCPTEDTRSR